MWFLGSELCFSGNVFGWGSVWSSAVFGLCFVWSRVVFVVSKEFVDLGTHDFRYRYVGFGMTVTS